MTRRLLRRLTGERGFTLAPMMGGLLVVLLLTAATAVAVDGDSRPSLQDRDRKQALAAAEAGIHDYLARLKVNPNYWTLCTDAANPNRNLALNQARATNAARGWAPVGNGPARYSIELLPVDGPDNLGTTWARCDTDEPQRSMIDRNEAFRIRSTGEARPGGKRRSLIATFRPDGFLDFIYYTDFETSDPAWYVIDSWGAATRGHAFNDSTKPKQSIVEWGYANCQKYQFEGRRNEWWVGRGWDASTWGSYANGTDGIYGLYLNRTDGRLRSDDQDRYGSWIAQCDEIQFAPNDKVLGPMHTNDAINVCGSPQFGERSTDVIRLRGGGVFADGWRSTCSGAQPNKVGQWEPNASKLDMPPSNTALREDAPSHLRFRGETRLRFAGDRVVVNGRALNGSYLANVSRPINDGEVIYVEDDTDPARPCGVTYQPLQHTTLEGMPDGCGTAVVEGTYARSITVGAQSDLVIREDVLRANERVVLGLISNNWVRVWHPIELTREGADQRVTGCKNHTTQPHLGDVQIDAAIMSVKHSFTVDGYFCGDGTGRLGTLTIRGAIAQKYRGPVGTTLGADTGYIKNYLYDRRLKFRSPPRFLDPVEPSWTLRSITEQLPAESW